MPPECDCNRHPHCKWWEKRVQANSVKTRDSTVKTVEPEHTDNQGTKSQNGYTDKFYEASHLKKL